MDDEPRGQPGDPPELTVPVQPPSASEVPQDWLYEYEHTEAARRLDRLAADQDLITSLALQGYQSPDYEVFQLELAKYGLDVISGWLWRGAIFGKCRQRGRASTAGRRSLARPRHGRGARERDRRRPTAAGTHLELGDGTSVLYTRGSVDFYSTYPGVYVPRPIGLRHRRATRSLSELAKEVLALTKMNWNQTGLDGLDPVTLRTANEVRRVLRFCDSESAIATRYAHYM